MCMEEECWLEWIGPGLYEVRRPQRVVTAQGVVLETDAPSSSAVRFSVSRLPQLTADGLQDTDHATPTGDDLQDTEPGTPNRYDLQDTDHGTPTGDDLQDTDIGTPTRSNDPHIPHDRHLSDTSAEESSPELNVLGVFTRQSRSRAWNRTSAGCLGSGTSSFLSRVPPTVSGNTRKPRRAAASGRLADAFPTGSSGSFNGFNIFYRAQQLPTSISSGQSFSDCCDLSITLLSSAASSEAPSMARRQHARRGRSTVRPFHSLNGQRSERRIIGALLEEPVTAVIAAGRYSCLQLPLGHSAGRSRSPTSKSICNVPKRRQRSPKRSKKRRAIILDRRERYTWLDLDALRISRPSTPGCIVLLSRCRMLTHSEERCVIYS